MSQPFNMMANGNITVARFVMMDPTAPVGSGPGNQVVQCGLGGKSVGISDIAGRTQPTPDVTDSPPLAAKDGENVRAHTLGDVCLLELGSGGCVPGDALKSDANGKGIVATSTASARVGATAIQGGAAGEYVQVQIVRYHQVASVAS